MSRVYGLFTTYDEADSAIQRLHESDYGSGNISVVMKDTVYQEHHAAGPVEGTAEGAVSGATTGGVVGAIAGLLIGVGAIAIPGIGGILIGGPLAAALGLSGAAATTVSGAVTGAAAGGILGALTGLGLSADTANTYLSKIQDGGVLVSVDTADSEQEAEVKNIMTQSHADRISVS